MPKHSSSVARNPLLGLVMAAAIVVLASAAGITAALLVVFPSAAWLVGYFLPDWVFITPVLGSLSASTRLLVLVCGAVLAACLIQAALWLAQRRPVQQLLRR